MNTFITREAIRKPAALFIAVLFVIALSAQTPEWSWAKNDAGTSGYNGANAVSADQVGNSYIAGSFANATFTLGSITMTNPNAGFDEIFVAKYAANGVVLWAKSFGGSDQDIANSVITDGTGNIYVSGSFRSASVVFGSFTITNTAAGYNDIFLVKFDTNGNVIWAKSYGGAYNDVASSVAGDAGGNLYFAGSFSSSSITFGSCTFSNTAPGGEVSDLFLAKCDQNGNVIWVKSAGGSLSDVANSVTVDPSGNVYLTGCFYSSSLSFGSYMLTNPNGTNSLFITKYDALGNVLWANGVNANKDVVSNSIASGVSGNIYITGYFKSDTVTFGPTALINPNVSGLGSMFVVKYDDTGNVDWVRSPAGNSSDVGMSIAVDANENIYVAGYYDSPTLSFGSLILNNVAVGRTDVFLAKYDLNGQFLLGKSAGGSDYDYVMAVAADPSGNIYFAGNSQSPTIKFDSIVLSNKPYSGDLFIAKLAPALTGIKKEISNSGITVFPNPTNGVLCIDLSSAFSEEAEIAIYDVRSRLVFENKLNDRSSRQMIDLSTLGEGLYIVKVNTKEAVYSKRIIKN